MSPSELQEYAGRYWSDELAVTYTVTVNGDQAVIQSPIGPVMSLTSPAHDAFLARAKGPPLLTLPSLTIHFTRDAAGAVTGFTLGAGPIHGVVFRRQ